MNRRSIPVCLSICLLLIAALSAGCAGFARKGKWGYPLAPKGDVVDDYHGTKVADPYRWLEDPDSDQTRAWVAEQNAITKRFVQTPQRPEIFDRLKALVDFPRAYLPVEEGGRVFFEKNTGLQNQDVLYVQAGDGGEPRVLIDPNTWSADGTVALVTWTPSRDGKKLAYARSAGGSDWQEVRVLDVDSGQEGPEVLRHCKFAGIAWHPDGTGFWYNRYPDPATQAPEQRNTHNKVYWHELGTLQEADTLVHEQPGDPLLGFDPMVSEDGRYLLLHVYKGTDPKNRIYYRPLASSGPFTRLLDAADASYSFLENIGPTFYFQTDRDAPRGRIVAVDIDRPRPDQWREVVPEGPDAIAYSGMVNNRFVIVRMRDAKHVLEIVDLNGALVATVPLPHMGSIYGLRGKREDTHFFFQFTSFLMPPATYRYDFATGRTTATFVPELRFDPDRYVTRQVFYTSKDGTRVPMFLTHKKGLKPDGKNPTLLYGYGGFNVSRTPYFSAARLMFVEQGGVYALANLRGGGEYGEAWHQAGVLGNKQNVFDDFIAAAEYLIAEKITSTDKLAILGGSNGGLLTAACMIQKPKLFGAVISAVPVIDMLRYHKFTVGKFWVSDYGNADESKEQFDFLYAYSPLHNIEPNTAYPPTLVTTADTDDRVVPSHGKKFIAALQAADGGDKPLLLRVETKAGHGGGKPVSKILDEKADMYAFLFRILGIPFQSVK